MPEQPPSLDDLAECILDCVAEIPRGRVSTYGRVAAEARARCGRGGPRTVGHVLAHHGDEVPWWRVVSASGAPAVHKGEHQLGLLVDEGVPLRGARVDLRLALHAFELPALDGGDADAGGVDVGGSGQDEEHA
ncbi:MAG: MGMT family protein [Salana multivorans]|uniref:MGMT family protein n=1 Tax=Salana multivorans TaxID=120377 RepID=UPI00095EEB1C|nr:MGMT family protein [Salana multivorans]MBN8883383.1 MGMT family protein [Salana multivorans]OJX95746.1 MAG: hypothetical protein BGO96_09090 [Micrococcales bacterium 73-15]